MAKIDISEFQFVFAFFHKFMSLTENAGKQFIVPSLLQEGGHGNADPDLVGTDLIIRDEYYFQFKVGHRLKQACSETRNGLLEDSFLPFFRFNIKNSPNSTQFNALVSLAEKKDEDKVFYIAPNFDYSNNANDDDAFNDFWQSDNATAVYEKVVWIDFHQWVDKNPYEDKSEHNDKHVICYNQDSLEKNEGYMFSEKKMIKLKYTDKVKPRKNIMKDKVSKVIDEISKVFSEEIREKNRDVKIDSIIGDAKLSDYNKIKEIQTLLIRDFNIVWTPIVEKID